MENIKYKVQNNIHIFNSQMQNQVSENSRILKSLLNINLKHESLPVKRLTELLCLSPVNENSFKNDGNVDDKADDVADDNEESGFKGSSVKELTFAKIIPKTGRRIPLTQSGNPLVSWNMRFPKV